jgi:hypothetical protein
LKDLLTLRRWEEVKTVYRGHSRRLFDDTRTSLRAWFTAKRETFEYELRDWDERRAARYTETGTTGEDTYDSQRTLVSDQVDTLLPKEFVLANSEAEVAAAPVEDDNDNDKTNQELMDELAAEED